MRKDYLVCSLLVAFSVSVFGLGCGGAKPVDTKAAGSKETPTTSVVKPGDSSATVKTETPKPATKKKPKSSGAGSTTGGGVEVPADPAGGTTEKPEAKPEDKGPEAKPEPKADEKTDAKSEEKGDDKKAEDK